jgi:hypothetical protein
VVGVSAAKEKATLLSQRGLYLCRQRPTLPRGFPRSTIGPAGLNFRVRDGNGCAPRGKITDKLGDAGTAVSQVLPKAVLPRSDRSPSPAAIKPLRKSLRIHASQLNRLVLSTWLVRGAGLLRGLRRVNFMVKPNGRLVLVSYAHRCASTSSLLNRWSSCALHYPFGLGDLILGSASRLYAFSGYHNRTSLPSHAVGTTAGTQEVRPSRSSRTKDRPSQISYAHTR